MHPSNCGCHLSQIESHYQKKEYLIVLNLLEENLLLPTLSEKCQRASFLLLEQFLVSLFPHKRLSKTSKKLFWQFFSLPRLKKWFSSPIFSFFHSLLFFHLTSKEAKLLKSCWKSYLQAEEISSLAKTFLLFFLHKHQINSPFLLIKNNQKVKIIPSQLTPYHHLPLYHFLQLFINQQLFPKNLSVAQVAQKLTENFFLFFYPFIPFQTKKKALALALTYQSFLALKLTPQWKELGKEFGLPFTSAKKIFAFLTTSDCFQS